MLGRATHPRAVGKVFACACASLLVVSCWRKASQADDLEAAREACVPIVEMAARSRVPFAKNECIQSMQELSGAKRQCVEACAKSAKGWNDYGYCRSHCLANGD